MWGWGFGVWSLALLGDLLLGAVAISAPHPLPALESLGLLLGYLGVALATVGATVWIFLTGWHATYFPLAWIRGWFLVLPLEFLAGVALTATGVSETGMILSDVLLVPLAALLFLQPRSMFRRVPTEVGAAGVLLALSLVLSFSVAVARGGVLEFGAGWLLTIVGWGACSAVALQSSGEAGARSLRRQEGPA